MRDYSKAVHQGRVGYETKVGALKPYIEGGFGVTYPEDGDQTNFTALEVGTKVKITEKLALMVSGKTSSKMKMIPVTGKLRWALSTSSDQ